MKTDCCGLLSAFTVVYLITAYYAGLYDRWYKRSELVRSTFDCNHRFAGRLCIVAGTIPFFKSYYFIWSLLAFVLIRLLRWILDSTEGIEQ